MGYRRSILVSVAAVAVFSSAPVNATAFVGSLFNTNPPAAAGGRCAPAALTVSIAPSLGASVGASNFGAFSATMSHCINLPLPTSYSDGLFTFDFGAGNLLTGTYSGVLSSSGSAGVFDNLENYLVTGGTGQFGGFSGTLTGTGTVTFAAGVPPVSQQSISGEIAAVPEPATWMMLLIGFAGIGYKLRRRSATFNRTFA